MKFISAEEMQCCSGKCYTEDDLYEVSYVWMYAVQPSALWIYCVNMVNWNSR